MGFMNDWTLLWLVKYIFLIRVKLSLGDIPHLMYIIY